VSHLCLPLLLTFGPILHSLCAVINLQTSRRNERFTLAGAFVALVLFAVISQACGGGQPPAEQPPAAETTAAQPTAPQPPAAAGPEFVSATPIELIKIYQDNDQYQADELAAAYMNKMLKVEAVVQSVTADTSGVVVVTSTGPQQDPKDPTTLRLQFPKEAAGALAAMKSGAPIQAGCTISRIDKTQIELTNCSII
jgi:hypothetical protein